MLTVHVGQTLKLIHGVLGHLPLCWLPCSYPSLISLLRTAPFARALQCAHLLSRDLMGKRFLSINGMRLFHTISTHSAVILTGKLLLHIKIYSDIFVSILCIIHKPGQHWERCHGPFPTQRGRVHRGSEKHKDISASSIWTRPELGKRKYHLSNTRDLIQKIKQKLIPCPWLYTLPDKAV